jgi:nickel-dependent lactate racemase
VTTVELPYGRETLRVRLPPDCDATVIHKPPMPVIADPATAVAAALDDPVGAPRLEDLARGCRTACVVVCDFTRPVPNRLLLRPVIDRLLTAGVPISGITVLVATGLHRPNEGDELADVIGDPWVLERVDVVNHRARIDEDHVELGRTKRGTPVRIDRRLAEADLRIVTGLVEPHFMAGWSGGRKVIAPGVAHAETITTLHNHGFMAHPSTTNCVLDGNPLHEELIEISRLLDDVVAVNTVIDHERRLSFVNFGDLYGSHDEAVGFARRHAEVHLPRRFHTVVTSAGGHPLDATYYQTVKAIVAPIDIVTDQGDLIVASSCSEGIGSPEFARSQSRLGKLGISGFLDDLAGRDRADIDEWQSQMQTRAQSRVRVGLYSAGLTADDRALTAVNHIDRVERAVADSIERHGDHAVAVIPEGPYVIPSVAEA